MESSPPAWGAWAQRAEMPPSRSRCRRAFSALSIVPVPTPALPQPQADGRSPAGDAGSWSSGGDACGRLKISPSRTPGRAWPSCRHKILIGGSSAAPSHWPRDKPSAGRGRKRQREGAASLAAGMGGRHRVLRARRAPAALLLLGLQTLAPGVKLWFLSGRSRRVLRLSASSLAGSSATWKTTGVSLVWSGLDPFCLPGPPSCKCTRVGGGPGPSCHCQGGDLGAIMPQDRVTRLCRGAEPLVPAQSRLSRGSEKGRGAWEGNSPACSPAHSPLGRGFWWLTEVGDGGTLLFHVPSSLGPR